MFRIFHDALARLRLIDRIVNMSLGACGDTHSPQEETTSD